MNLKHIVIIVEREDGTKAELKMSGEEARCATAEKLTSRTAMLLRDVMNAPPKQ